METLHKGHSHVLGLNPDPSYFEVTVLTISPPWFDHILGNRNKNNNCVSPTSLTSLVKIGVSGGRAMGYISNSVETN